MGQRVVLIRHAKPQIDPSIPTGEWGLSEQGWRDAAALGERLFGLGITHVLTSTEPKAIQTGEGVASVLGLAISQVEELGEQGLGTVPWLENPVEFQAKVERHFAEPDQRVLGDESSIEAGERFAKVVSGLGEEELIALVSHGRIMAAWLARIGWRPAMEIWQDLRMPDALLVDVEAGTWSRIGDS